MGGHLKCLSPGLGLMSPATLCASYAPQGETAPQLQMNELRSRATTRGWLTSSQRTLSPQSSDDYLPAGIGRRCRRERPAVRRHALRELYRHPHLLVTVPVVADLALCQRATEAGPVGVSAPSCAA